MSAGHALCSHGHHQYVCSALTFGLQLRPQVDRLMPGLVGVNEIARIPGGCTDGRNIRPGEQEAACWRLLCLQLSRDRGLSICLRQALNVPGVPTRRLH